MDGVWEGYFDLDWRSRDHGGKSLGLIVVRTVPWVYLH